MKLIHKSGHDNVVPHALNKREAFQAMSTTQTLWLMYKGEGDLQCKLRKGYINHPEPQSLLVKLRKGKALKEVKLMDGLLNYKKSQVYVLQGK